MIAAAVFAGALTRFVIMHGDVNAYGVPGTAVIVVDRQTGRFARRFKAGPASEQEGFDGVQAWRADATGMGRIQGNTGERREIAGWSSALKSAINSTAHEAQAAGATDRVTIGFEDYRRFGKLSVPERVISRSEQNGTWTVHVRSVETRANLPAALFSPPARPPADFRLAHLTRVRVSMETRSPVLDVRINGATLHFLFDTGGQNVITTEAAKRIGLKVVGSGIVGGGGGGTASIAFAQVRTVQIGDALLLDQPFIVLPADSLPPVDGIVGYELLARFAARLDMAHETLELAPDAKAFGAAAAPAKFAYFDRQPQVAGSLDGITGAFSIDTGSSLTAQIQRPVVSKYDLVRTLHATVAAYASDVGGRYPIFLVRARKMRLGPASFPDPVVDLLTRKTSNNESIVANVGDGILRRWVIVFDYPRQRIDFRPGGDPAGVVIHDRSGMVLTTKDDEVVVAQVLSGTPAARASLSEGDQIVAVDGSAVKAADLARVRTMLQGKPGTLVHLQLANGTTHDLTLLKYL